MQAQIPKKIKSLVEFYASTHEEVTAEASRVPNVWRVKGVKFLATSTLDEADDMGLRLVGAKHESNGMTLFFREVDN